MIKCVLGPLEKDRLLDPGVVVLAPFDGGYLRLLGWLVWFARPIRVLDFFFGKFGLII